MRTIIKPAGIDIFVFAKRMMNTTRRTTIRTSGPARIGNRHGGKQGEIGRKDQRRDRRHLLLAKENAQGRRYRSTERCKSGIVLAIKTACSVMGFVQGHQENEWKRALALRSEPARSIPASRIHLSPKGGALRRALSGFSQLPADDFTRLAFDLDIERAAAELAIRWKGLSAMVVSMPISILSPQ
ncbi:MAG: hypothetical protein U1G07_15085 [Verrucomicrobiota bacterium]